MRGLPLALAHVKVIGACRAAPIDKVRAFASGARLLILDEPLGGMGAEETGRVTALLRALSVNHTVVLIEHDMDAIFAVADTLTVLVEGKLLAHGKPEDIRRDRAVREAYLGRWGQEIVR